MEGDITYELAYPRKPGGQHVGLARTDIKATHEPTGNFVVVGGGRSMRQNREIAALMLKTMVDHMRGSGLS